MGVRVRIEDRGAKRAKKMAAQPRKVLRLGVLPREAALPHPSRQGVTVGDVARWNEYGTPDTPARSWLRDWVDINERDIIQNMITDTLRLLFQKQQEGEAEALGKRGTVYRRSMIDRIRYENAFVGNRPSTIKKKGFDLPLIDTETFVESIRWDVVD